MCIISTLSSFNISSFINNLSSLFDLSSNHSFEHMKKKDVHNFHTSIYSYIKLHNDMFSTFVLSRDPLLRTDWLTDRRRVNIKSPPFKPVGANKALILKNQTIPFEFCEQVAFKGLHVLICIFVGNHNIIMDSYTCKIYFSDYLLSCDWSDLEGNHSSD
jgi:hypothetical protein